LQANTAMPRGLCRHSGARHRRRGRAPCRRHRQATGRYGRGPAPAGLSVDHRQRRHRTTIGV